VPTIPPWFAEVVILARHFRQQGYLEAISEQVHLARGRAGTFEVLDFVAVLLGYAVSGEPTLEAFFDRLAPFALPFMALFGRNHLPHRATLSRFLAAVDRPCLAALRQLFLQDRLHLGFRAEQLGGFLTAQGQRLIVVDVDGTRQAARQRALATTSDLPAPKRRMEGVCAPGYTGRQRGEVVRTRTTVLQAHTQEWLASFSNSGSGDYTEELLAACQAITTYLTAKGLTPADVLLRLDGLYGTVALVARLQSFQLGFLTRGRDYQLLDHPTVQARLQHPCDLITTHPETQVQREVYEVGSLVDWLADRPDLRIVYRVVLTRRAAPPEQEQISVGKRRGDYVYELFLTSHSASSLPAAVVLELYQHRGSFEQVLSDEDQEQDPDRWCSHTPCGQEFWQILSQWAWNTRLTLGSVAAWQSLRWTRWDAAAPAATPALQGNIPEGELSTISAPEAQAELLVPEAPSATVEPDSTALVPIYGPLRFAHSWVKARREFSAQAFRIGEGDTVICPAGKVLRPCERRVQPNGELRVLYRAKVNDCRTCSQVEACLGESAPSKRGRRVSGVRQIVGWDLPRTLVAEQSVAEPSRRQPDGEEARIFEWADIGGRRVRRDLVAQLRRQQVTIALQETPSAHVATTAVPRVWTRAERAHRRRSWAGRGARNACASETPSFRVTVYGIASSLAAYLGLPSTPAP
jgi:hypothetical protein